MKKWRKRRNWTPPPGIPNNENAKGYQSLSAWKARLRQQKKSVRARERVANRGLTRVGGGRAIGFRVTWPDGTSAVWRFGEGVTAVATG